MKQIFLFLLLPLLCIACDYDQDFEFVPETRAAYFLMAENGQHQLRKVDADGSILANWGENVGLSNPTDIAGNGGELWISLAAEQKLILLNLETEMQKESFDLGDFQAHYLSLGTRYLLLSDTVNQELGFFHLKKRTLIRLEVAEKPGKAVYRSSKFFLQLGEQSVAIYNETALAPYTTLDFSRPIIDLVLDNRYSTWVFSQDSLIYRSSISWNSLAKEGAEEQVNETKVRNSPYLQASFGKEYTRKISLIDGRLSNFPGPLADDFEMDAFESVIYFTYSDSLNTKSIFQNEIHKLGPFSGTFRNAYFYITEVGN